MDPMKSPHGHPPRDAARGNTGPNELIQGDDAVLPRGDLREALIWDGFLPHTGTNPFTGAACPPTQPICGPAMRDA